MSVLALFFSSYKSNFLWHLLNHIIGYENLDTTVYTWDDLSVIDFFFKLRKQFEGTQVSWLLTDGLLVLTICQLTGPVS